MAKKHSKNSFLRCLAIFDQFFGYKSDIFCILQDGFLLDHQWFKALLLMYNMTKFDKKILTFISDIWGHCAHKLRGVLSFFNAFWV